MRIDTPELEQMSPEQRAVYENIVQGPRGVFRGPATVWIHQPALADAAQALGAYCRYGTSLPASLSEMAILCVAAYWRSDYEWWAHEPMARKAGLSENIISCLRAGAVPDNMSADEQMVYQVSQSLQETRQVSDSLYAKASSVLSEAGLVDLIGVLGYYTFVSMTLNCFQLKTPDGSTVFSKTE